MIRVENLCFRAGDFCAEDISLAVPAGEYFALLGPTGAGKTLFLRCVCGLIRPSSGTVHINGRDVTHLEPRLRGVGYVPQHFDLFPHMTTGENITFSLRVQGLSHAKALEQIGPLLETLRLGPLLSHSPASLSGGERQKVALARALARRPDLLLLDEPVSSLDAPTRRDVCTELRRVQKQYGIATIHVCHNVNEATAVSDRAGVLCDGRLIQTGTLEELLREPKNDEVVRLLRPDSVSPA